ncbi:MAG: hypothetical protein ACRDK0_10600 [Solirubrobacteraceae bacterium]
MPTLQLEHSIKDFAMWKAAFDRDPIDRRGLGVRRHRIFRPLDDLDYVVVELEFDSTTEAQACGVALRELWSSRQAAPALVGAPRVRIVEAVEDHEY